MPFLVSVTWQIFNKLWINENIPITITIVRKAEEELYRTPFLRQIQIGTILTQFAVHRFPFAIQVSQVMAPELKAHTQSLFANGFHAYVATYVKTISQTCL